MRPFWKLKGIIHPRKKKKKSLALFFFSRTRKTESNLDEFVSEKQSRAENQPSICYCMSCEGWINRNQAAEHAPFRFRMSDECILM